MDRPPTPRATRSQWDDWFQNIAVICLAPLSGTWLFFAMFLLPGDGPPTFFGPAVTYLFFGGPIGLATLWTVVLDDPDRRAAHRRLALWQIAGLLIGLPAGMTFIAVYCLNPDSSWLWLSLPSLFVTATAIWHLALGLAAARRARVLVAALLVLGSLAAVSCITSRRPMREYSSSDGGFRGLEYESEDWNFDEVLARFEAHKAHTGQPSLTLHRTFERDWWHLPLWWSNLTHPRWELPYRPP